MLVRFTSISDPLYEAARGADGDDGFTAQQVAERVGVAVDDVLAALDRYMDRDVCCRLDDDLTRPATAETPWCLMRHSLTRDRLYEVLAVSYDYYRLLNDPETWPYGNDPVLFHASLFEIVDPTEPSFWVQEIDGDDVYRGPAEWTGDFFERFHDRDAETRAAFRAFLRKHYPRTAAERGLDADDPGSEP